MYTRIKLSAFALGASFILHPSDLLAQGALTPPGAPAPTMKTLDQLDAKLEKRTPITSLPFNIDSPGSYYVVSNLSSASGLTIKASDVTVDLNGFRLQGTGFLVGISVNASRTNIYIRNGTVSGWTDGVDLTIAHGVVMEDVRAAGNAGMGIAVGRASVISRCTTISNLSWGLVALDASTIRDCTVLGSASDGILASDSCRLIDSIAIGNVGSGADLGVGATVRNCTVNQNISGGIVTRAGSIVSDCTVIENQGSGIRVGDNSTVRDCRSNGSRFDDGIRTGAHCMVMNCGSVSNAVNGISVLGDSVVVGCHGSLNGRSTNAAGIFTAGSGSRIENNQVRDNNGYGIQATAGDLILRNSAGNNSTNYLPSSGANFAPIQSPSSATNAWGNFVF